METAPREEGRAKNGGAGSWTLEPQALLSVTVNCVSLGTSLPFWKHSLRNATGLTEAQTGHAPRADSYYNSNPFNVTHIY